MITAAAINSLMMRLRRNERRGASIHSANSRASPGCSRRWERSVAMAASTMITSFMPAHPGMAHARGEARASAQSGAACCTPLAVQHLADLQRQPLPAERLRQEVHAGIELALMDDRILRIAGGVE